MARSSLKRFLAELKRRKVYHVAVVRDFFRAMEGWDHDGLRAIVTEVSGEVAWTRYNNRAVLHMQAEESLFHWIESAVLQRQPDGSWKIDRLQSTPVSIEGAMAEH